MKKALLILCTTIIGLSAQAQEWFPTNNAIWNEEYRISPWGFHQFGMKGETIINDTLYQNLYSLSDTTLDCIDEQSLPYGFIRQEGQKVFFKPYYWNYPDILLYDFGASVGDTVWHGGVTHIGSYFEVSDIYSIIQEIKTENGKKIFYVDRISLDDIWYENIGSYRGLFGSISKIPLYEPYPTLLVCFKHNNIVEFLDNPKCNKCFCNNNSIDDTKIETIQIFPNPTTGELTIDNGQLTINNVEVFDIYGRKIHSSTLTSYLSPLTSINISHLPSGIYFVKISTEAGEVVRKVIKN